MRMAQDNLPYEGIKVLDLSQGVAGPYCAMLLAAQGANVIKLEPPKGCWSRTLGKSHGQGDEIQSAHSLVVHQGKRSIAVNLKDPEGIKIAKRLADWANIIILNHLDIPAGLDYKAVKGTNNSVIYMHITGFGPDGPMAGQGATDSVMQSRSGLAALNRDGDGVPQQIKPLAIDIATGLYASQEIAAALFRRLKTGEGAFLETSLLQCSLRFQAAALIESKLQGGKQEPIGMPVGIFKTRDGFISINARRNNHFEGLCELLGYVDARAKEWVSEERFATPEARVANGKVLLGLIRPLIETKTTSQWDSLLAEKEILRGVIHTHHDLFDDPQVAAIGALKWIDASAIGRIPIALIGAQSHSDLDGRLTRSPNIGEHTHEVLSELGLSGNEIAGLITRKVVLGSARPISQAGTSFQAPKVPTRGPS